MVGVEREIDLCAREEVKNLSQNYEVLLAVTLLAGHRALRDP